ncbi:MAG: hypothetical protein NTZ09_11515 [Candidatus Hydrogenedentes bacterium]|nr:hypothetical protein [Candidatus Hydrogenedentota bacterium]
MSWKAVMEEPIIAVAEGEYEGTVVDVRFVDGPHGEMVRIDFMLSGEEEYEGRQVSGVASRRLSENTKLGRWIAAIFGRTPAVGEEVTAQALLHKDCRVVVKHKTNPDGKTFANVVEVMPVTEIQV